MGWCETPSPGHMPIETFSQRLTLQESTEHLILFLEVIVSAGKRTEASDIIDRLIAIPAWSLCLQAGWSADVACIADWSGVLMNLGGWIIHNYSLQNTWAVLLKRVIVEKYCSMTKIKRRVNSRRCLMRRWHWSAHTRSHGRCHHNLYKAWKWTQRIAEENTPVFAAAQKRCGNRNEEPNGAT